jgi:hypothetical protein
MVPECSPDQMSVREERRYRLVRVAVIVPSIPLLSVRKPPHRMWPLRWAYWRRRSMMMMVERVPGQAQARAREGCSPQIQSRFGQDRTLHPSWRDRECRMCRRQFPN